MAKDKRKARREKHVLNEKEGFPHAEKLTKDQITAQEHEPDWTHQQKHEPKHRKDFAALKGAAA